MKASRYNFFFRVDGQTVLAYNTLTTALVELSTEEWKHLEDFFEDSLGDLFEIRELDELKDQLMRMGIIVPNDYNELEYIKAARLALKQDNQRFGLTILPTLACNLRCSYCFSYSSKTRMSSRVQHALLRFADERLQDADGLSVSWFGGEPTLCLDIIEYLSRELTTLCETHNVPMAPGSILSNGYLLTERTAMRLKAAGIARAQITVDGGREIHDQRRPLRGGQGTFERILDNIAQVEKILDIHIRINIDRDNIDGALGALEALEARRLQGRVGVYFGHVKPFTEACADVVGTCLSNREFSEHSLALTKEALRRGFLSFPYPQLQLGGVCGANRKLNYVVAPDGLLFKCWAEASVGAEWSVGSILEGDLTWEQQKNLKRFLSWDPTAYDQCQECRLLPICMGGCPHARIRHNDGLDCSTWRYNLLETLAIRYKLGSRIQPRRAQTEMSASGDPR